MNFYIHNMKFIISFLLCIFVFSTALMSCGEIGDNSGNTGDLSSPSGNGTLNSSSGGNTSGSSSSGTNFTGSSDWKLESAEKVAFQYKPETGSYSLVFQNMKIEGVAIASLSAENICGIRFDYRSKCIFSGHDRLEFFINDKLHHEAKAYCTGGEYSESFSCGSYVFTWKITKQDKDSVPNWAINDITKLSVKDTSYAPNFSFESGWATDLQTDGWYLNNRDKYQGSYSLNAGWMRDEENQEVRINLPDTATKLNLYYKFSNSSSKYKDFAYIIIGNHIWNLPTAYNWSKFSTILSSQDNEAIIKFTKREDGFSSFFLDDIRTLRYAPAAQTNNLWDFEEGFYPTEVSGDWWIDNFGAYKGEYSLRAPLNADGVCGFDIDIGQADSVSFWHKCSYSGIKYPQIRIGTSEDYIVCNCSSSWNECKTITRGQMPLHIETDCVPDYDRRIDYIKAW